MSKCERFHCKRNPLCPSHQSRKLPSSWSEAATSSSSASFFRTGWIKLMPTFTGKDGNRIAVGPRYVSGANRDKLAE